MAVKFDPILGDIREADAGSGTGTVESVSVTTANGISGTVSDPTVNAAISLSLEKEVITGKSAVTAVGTDYVLISDTSDSGNLKKALVSDFGGGGDMTLAGVQSVTGLKTFDKDKVAMKGTSTGVTTISTANTSASDYTATLQAVTGTIAYLSNLPKKSIVVQIGDGVNVITTGELFSYVRVPFNGTITKVSLLAKESGSIVIDVWKDTYANFPPTVADTIVASAKPTLSSAQKSEDSTLTGWTTTVSAGDCFKFKVDSATTVTDVVMTIEIQPSGL